MTSWHALSGEDALKELGSNEKGLADSEVQSKLEKYGRNKLKEGKRTTVLELILNQLKDFLILLLIAAAVISIAVSLHENSVQELVEAGLIVLIIVFIVIVGFYQEYSAEKELEALKRMMTPQAVVLRNGVKEKIDATELVPGDIVYFESGDRIPADIRVLKAVELKIDESSLTGESNAVHMSSKELSEDTALGDRSNMAYLSTTVVYGKGYGVVVETGMQTEIGKIAESIQDIKQEETPLQARLSVLGKQIGVIVIFLSIIVFTAGVLATDAPLLDMLIVAIALAVAAVPEGLPGVVTIALATGTRRMVKEHAIIRRLPAVETLGSTTVICTDKTGTLTKNEMTVRKLWVNDANLEVEGEGYGTKGRIIDGTIGPLDEPDMPLEKALQVCVLCNNASHNDGKITGDPTAASLLVLAAKMGYTQKGLEKEYERKDEITFSSERKMMTTIDEHNGGLIAHCKGAPDVILSKCSKIIINSREEQLTDELREKVLDKNAEFASKAYRVLGLAYRNIEGEYTHENVENNLVFVGLAAMIDPPREESKKSVADCRSAGVRVVMITGDHKLTAKAIAEEIGIYQQGDNILTGVELEAMSDKDLLKVVDDTSIYARVSPIHKLRIVEALQSKGNVVAMTGDGVNDAPALKKSDIGIAMGITGTDVSKEASDMVLTDDNFSSIVKAVEEGRGIYDNIRKFFAYLISGNIGEVGVVFLSSVMTSVPLALTASQILIINLVTDGLPALALGVDPFEPGAMERKPRPKKEPLHKGLAPFIGWYPMIMIIVTMGLFLWVWDPVKQNVFEAQTTAFLTIAFFEMYQAFACRSTRYPALKVGLLKNKWLIAAVAFSFLIIVGILYLPLEIPFTDISLQELTHTSPLSMELFITIVLVSSLGFIYLEIQKWWNNRNKKNV